MLYLSLWFGATFIVSLSCVYPAGQGRNLNDGVFVCMSDSVDKDCMSIISILIFTVSWSIIIMHLGNLFHAYSFCSYIFKI